jgi:hypothetical protein
MGKMHVPGETWMGAGTYVVAIAATVRKTLAIVLAGVATILLLMRARKRQTRATTGAGCRRVSSSDASAGTISAVCLGVNVTAPSAG